MEERNIRNILRIVGKDPEGKVKLLLDYSDNPRDIADPWYTGDFESTYRDVVEGCEGFLAYLEKMRRYRLEEYTQYDKRNDEIKIVKTKNNAKCAF